MHRSSDPGSKLNTYVYWCFHYNFTYYCSLWLLLLLMLALPIQDTKAILYTDDLKEMGIL